MTSTTTRGLLYSSLHRFNNALENLESFQKEKDIIENIGYYSDGYSYCHPFNNERYDTFKDAFNVAFPNKKIETAKYVVNEEIVFCEYNVKEEK